jgi:hypothetical protein
MRNKNKHTIISNKLIEEQVLSYTARFVYIYIASRPNGWRVCNNDIKKGIGISEDKARGAILELIDFGYLSLAQVKDENGKLSYTITFDVNCIQYEINSK